MAASRTLPVNNDAVGSKAAETAFRPLVTLAVTTRNRTTYLSEVLGCVLAQDYVNLEVVVSDNGSADDTRYVSHALAGADPRVRFRYNVKAVSQHEHFNQCVQEARGEYFVLLHDDDRINARFVSELVAVAKRYPDVNVVVPANITIDEEGAIIQEFGRPDTDVSEGAQFICNWLHGVGPQIIACVATILAKTDVVRHFGGYQGLQGGRNIDNLLFLQCALTSRVGFADKASFLYRTYAKSYGSTVQPIDVVRSGAEFLSHLRHDPCTVGVLSRLPSTGRESVLKGAANATAKEVVLQMSALRLPYRLPTIAQFVSIRRDAPFLFVISREYLRHSWPQIHAWGRAAWRAGKRWRHRLTGRSDP